MTHSPRPVAWTLIGLLVFVGRTSAQETSPGTVPWRGDYNAARKEAAEKGRPVFLDIGGEACFHCKRMDNTTFRDPAVVALLADRFVPVKVNGDQEPNLVQALRITAYPTLIVAGTDGKIHSVIEGYVESGRLLEQLQRAIAAGTPDWMARDYQEATRSVGTGDYARAISLLRHIAEDGKDQPVQVKARQALGEIEQQASGRLARARQMCDRGQGMEAIDGLTELLRRYPGTVAAHDGGELLSSLNSKPELRDGVRAKRAREILALARDDYRTERYLACLEHCDTLATAYRGLPEGVEGAQLATLVRDNPERMSRAVADMNDRMGAMYMALAQSHIKRGNHTGAAQALEKLVTACPTCSGASEARVQLASLQGKTNTQQATFQPIP